MNDARRRGTAVFTLIELLVVVAIIAVLASLLLPALASARAKAKQITCLNNLKTNITAMHMYADDNEGFFPRTNRFGIEWMQSLDIYLDHDRNWPSTQMNHATSPQQVYKNFQCPTTVRWVRGLYYKGCYGYNTTVTSYVITKSTDTRYVRAYPSMEHPSETAMTADCYITSMTWGELTQSATPNPDGTTANDRYHEGYTLNIAFADGGVLNLRRGQRTDLIMYEDGTSVSRGWY